MIKNTLATTFLTLLLLTGAASLLSACNTTAGAGKDISAAGKAINNEAEENKTY
jgi:predicted small secreted protein